MRGELKETPGRGTKQQLAWLYFLETPQSFKGLKQVTIYTHRYKHELFPYVGMKYEMFLSPAC